jgi:hypothetical protein
MDPRAAKLVLWKCPLCPRYETVTRIGATIKRACRECKIVKGRKITDRIRQSKKAWGEKINRRTLAPETKGGIR